MVGLKLKSVSTTNGNQESGHKPYKVVILFQLGIVGVTIIGCFLPIANRCDSDTKQHIANMMTVITTSTFALYAAEK